MENSILYSIEPSIKRAELQFKYAITLMESYRRPKNRPQLINLKSISSYSLNTKGYLSGFSIDEWKSLNSSEEKRAVGIIEKQAIYMISVYVYQAFEVYFNKGRFPVLRKSKNFVYNGLDILKNTTNDLIVEEIKNIIDVFRLTRHAFAHNPIQPTWLIDHTEKKKSINIDNKIMLVLADLHGKTIEFGHFEGQLGLIYLLNTLLEKIKKL